MNYKIIDQESYYRKGVFRHFTEDCKCSTSMTTRIDVTDLVASSKASGTKFYINFLYLLANVLNSLNIELPDGFLIANVFRLLDKEIAEFCR